MLSSQTQGPAKVLQKIEDHQQYLESSIGSRALILIVSMGSDAENSLHRQIACANEGAWSFVKEGDDPLEKMASYDSYIITGKRVSGFHLGFTWISVAQARGQ